MIYAKFDVDILDHAKLLDAGAVGRDLWSWGVLYCQKHQTDGALPMAAVLATPWGAGGKGNVRVAAKLVSVGLWERTDKGWAVCRYAKKNQTRSEIDQKKAEARDRMASVRANRKRTQERTSSEQTENNSSVYREVVPGVGVGVNDLPDPGGGPGEGSTARYAEAYAAGIAKGKSAPYAWPGTKYAQWDLGKIIQTFAKDPSGKPYRGDQLLEWIRHTAGEFAIDVIAEKKAQFYSSFAPSGCLKWLNEDALATEARRVG